MIRRRICRRDAVEEVRISQTSTRPGSVRGWAVFADESGAGEGGSVHADGKIVPVDEITARLDSEGHTGAVQRAGEEEAEGLAVGISEEAAAGRNGAGLRRVKVEGEFDGIAESVAVMITVRSGGGISLDGGGPLGKSDSGRDDTQRAVRVELRSIPCQAPSGRTMRPEGGKHLLIHDGTRFPVTIVKFSTGCQIFSGHG